MSWVQGYCASCNCRVGFDPTKKSEVVVEGERVTLCRTHLLRWERLHLRPSQEEANKATDNA